MTWEEVSVPVCPCHNISKKKIPFVFLHTAFSLAKPLGAQHITQCWGCGRVVSDASAGLVTALHAGNGVFGCGF